jgi:hypothetical protein
MGVSNFGYLRSVWLAAGRGLVDIDPPGLAIIEAEFLFALVGQEIEGAFDVFGSERRIGNKHRSA